MKVSFWYVAIASIFNTCLLTANSIAVKLIAHFGLFVPGLLCTQGKWRETLLQGRSDPVWYRVTVDTPATQRRFPHAQAT